MQVTKDIQSPTIIKLTIVADSSELEQTKQSVLQKLAATVRLQGFRPGKAPLNIVERNVDPNQLQTDFLEQAVNDLYVRAIDQERIRPVAQPTISIVKFVPFTTLELTAEVAAVGDITLADYKQVKIAKKPVEITEAQIDAVVKDLQTRVAKREAVTRGAKTGDEATIDFTGTDFKTKEPIAGADGTDYPLILGSGNFIPGFEDKVIGMKVDETKEFPLTFPADYGSAALQNKKVTFAVTVKLLQALVEPKVDAAFAAEIGPFKTVAELKKDIRRELETQAMQENDRQYESDLLEAIAKKTTVAIPDSMIDEELERLEQQEKQNILYRGQTWQEHLDEEGVTDEEHKAKNRPGAELRIKSGLILGEIAELENISVTPEELEIRLQLLKGRYATDENMQTELDKPENRRDIMSRLMTEKTLDKLKSFQSK